MGKCKANKKESHTKGLRRNDSGSDRLELVGRVREPEPHGTSKKPGTHLLYTAWSKSK